jgi:hypothetical protein
LPRFIWLLFSIDQNLAVHGWKAENIIMKHLRPP